MKVKQAMHGQVKWCEPSMPVAKIAKLMKANDIGAIPVGENDRLIGMVTDRDIALRAVANGRDLSKTTARNVMSKGVSYCNENDRLSEAVHLMEEKQIRRLPVINDEKRMVGMLSLGDVTHAAGKSTSGGFARAVSGHH